MKQEVKKGCNNMKTTTKLSKENKIIEEITKAQTKKFISEVKQTTVKNVSELQKDILKKCNYDIFDKNYISDAEDEKAVFLWFIQKRDNLFNNMNFEVQRILNVYNKTNNCNMSIEELVHSDNKLINFIIGTKAPVSLNTHIISTTENIFEKSNIIYFDDLSNFDYEYFFSINYIFSKLAIIKEAVINKNGKNTKKIINLLYNLLNRP